MGYLSNTAHGYYSGTNLGNYQYLSLKEIIDNFTATYIGEGKILKGVLGGDVSFHAHRALAELTYDTFKSCKSQEITLPPSLVMPLPQDYVNYVKLAWSDANGIEHVIYPASKTSNPNSIAQDSDGNYIFDDKEFASKKVTKPTLSNPKGLVQFPFKLNSPGLTVGQTLFKIFPHILGHDPTTVYNLPGNSTHPYGYPNYADTNPFEVGMEIVSPYFPAGTTITTVQEATSSLDASITLSHASTNTTAIVFDWVPITILDKNDTWSKYKSSGGSTSTGSAHLHGSTSHRHYDEDSHSSSGYKFNTRYGLDPQYAQANGSFFIDCVGGKIHFSSNLSGKTIILKYISDGLGTDDEMVVPKLAEEAIYKWIAYGCAQARSDVDPGTIARFKKEKAAETRKAKLRLSNIKIEELTQTLRGKSKWIKH